MASKSKDKNPRTREVDEEMGEDLKWYEITFRGTAQMVVRVLAETPEAARQRAEDGNYEDESDIEFVKGTPYTLKVRRAPVGEGE